VNDLVDVHVSQHAGEAAIERFGPLSPAAAYELVRQEVREALERGRVSQIKPKPFRLYGRSKSKHARPGQKVVWNHDLSHGYVIANENGRVIVITVLAPCRRAAAA
jgi:hypothetical protein